MQLKSTLTTPNPNPALVTPALITPAHRSPGLPQITVPDNSYAMYLGTGRHTPTQVPGSRDASGVLLQQLRDKDAEINRQRETIRVLVQQQEGLRARLGEQRDVVRAFYAKGVPVESALAREVFEGSYPTLVEQAAAMRKQLALKNSELQALQLQHSRENQSLAQYHYMTTHMRNRIYDLETKLNQIHQYIAKIQDYERVGRIEDRNQELEGRLRELQHRSEALRQERDRIIEAVNAERRMELQRRMDMERRVQKQAVVPDREEELRRKERQVAQLHEQLNRLRQQNKIMEKQCCDNNSVSYQISVLDQKQRNPFTLSASTLDRTHSDIDWQTKINNIKRQNQVLKQKIGRASHN